MGNKITVQAVGGSSKTLEDCQTVGQAKQALGLPNHVASVNGRPATDGEPLPDYAFVSLTENVKGGAFVA